MKDYITIVNEENKTIKTELVATFRLELSNKDCIIYKSLNDDKYYAASYTGDFNKAKLNHNFNEKEKLIINDILKTILGGKQNDRI